MDINDADNPGAEIGIGVSDAASQIADLLDPVEDNEEGGDQGDSPQADDQLENIEDDVEVETDEADPETDDDEGDPEEGEAEDSEDDQTEVYAVKVDGEELEVTIDELLDGYSRTQDYTRKTMALAEQRKDMDSLRSSIEGERQQYAHLLPLLEAQLQSAMEEAPDLDAMFETDPIRATQVKHEWDKRNAAQQEKLLAIRSEQERVNAAIQQDAQARYQHHVASEIERLPSVVSEWGDQKVMADELTQIKSWALDQGMTEDAVEGIDNADMLGMMRKAWLYDKGQKRVVKKRVKPSKNMRPGSSDAQQKRNVSKSTRAKQRLAKTGTLNDAASVIETML